MLESLEDLNDIPRDKIDWKLYIRKTGRSDQDLVGYMLVKEKVGPVGVSRQIFEHKNLHNFYLPLFFHVANSSY